MNNKKFYHKDKTKTTDVWLTPPHIINSLGNFDLDPCSPNNLQWKTAANFYSLENNEDGLLLPWEGRIWLNPPYSDWVPFLEKLKNHGNGIALIFARTETKGFHDHIWNDADSIFFFKSRIKFLNIQGRVVGTPTSPSVLIAYGKENTKALENSKLSGKLVYLKK